MKPIGSRRARWAGATVVVSMLVFGSAGFTARAKPDVESPCAGDRWPVKTLSDTRSRLVDFTPRSTTVTALRALHPPHTASRTARAHGVETTTYQVRAALVRMKLFPDRDIHLAVADPNDPVRGHVMAVELPDPTCAGVRSSRKVRAMRRVRQSLIRACGRPRGDFVELDGSAVITGVGFFDTPHGRSSEPSDGIHAPNGIELHPAVAIRSISCRRR